MGNENRSETTLHLYSIDNPPWHQVTDRHRDGIVKVIERGGWHSVEGMRQGFLNCQRQDNIVYGYFAQEGSLRVEQYDDFQQPKPDDQKSFERIFFLIFLEEGVCVIQSLRLSRFIDLTGPLLRRSLFRSLEAVFREAGVISKRAARFERYRVEFTREQLLEIFEVHSIKRIVVENLLNGHVPDGLKLFNPDFDADGFLKAVIEDDLKLSDEVVWAGQNIQATKIARGLLYAGDPRVIEGIDADGELREWELSATQTISLELDTNEPRFPEEDLQRLLGLIRRKFGAFRERLARLQEDKLGDLPLFDGPQD